MILELIAPVLDGWLVMCTYLVDNGADEVGGFVLQRFFFYYYPMIVPAIHSII